MDGIVEKMCHAPADLFAIKNRGYIQEGFYADLISREFRFRADFTQILRRFDFTRIRFRADFTQIFCADFTRI